MLTLDTSPEVVGSAAPTTILTLPVDLAAKRTSIVPGVKLVVDKYSTLPSEGSAAWQLPLTIE